MDQLKPGMRVSRDIVRDGFVLLAARTELTPQLLRMLARWSVGMVEVIGTGHIESGNPGEAQFTPEVIQAATEHVNRRFLRIPSDNLGAQHIRKLAILRQAAKLARQGHSRGPASA